MLKILFLNESGCIQEIDKYNLPTSMVNEQAAEFAAPSVKMYVTVVTPIENLSPGWCVRTSVGCEPELSVAVGSIHVAIREVVPNGT